MNTTLGNRIAMFRKQRKMTQDELAERLGLSSQAVSKWENDLSCPDIMLLPELARLLETTVDELLTGEHVPQTRLVPEKERKKPEDMLLRICMDTEDGDRLRVNLPLPLVRMGMAMNGMGIQMNGSKALEQLDVEQILQLADSGVMGKLVEMESGGDRIEVWVE